MFPIVEEGNSGFGIINTNGSRLGFLYAPNVTSPPTKNRQNTFCCVFSGWDYAIGEDKVELKLGETYLLGAYRESKGNSLQFIEGFIKNSKR